MTSRAAQPHVLAEPGRRLPRHSASPTAATNASSSSRERRLPVEPLERVEQVAGAELRPQARERVRSRDEVEAECRSRARAPRRTGRAAPGTRSRARGGRARSARTCPRLRPVGEWTRMRAAFSRTASQTSPCAIAARERLRGVRLRLAPSELRVRDVSAGAEVRRDVAPASLLDAGDGDRDARLRLREHAHVEDPVLLRADELLAVVEQDASVERVVDGELGHAARTRSSR